MEAVMTLPRGRAFTVEDLEEMPDDGNRYELIDGALLVTPAPSVRHQRLSVRLTLVLTDACPAGLWVLAAPLDVVLGDATSVQPDLLVAHRSDFTEKNLPTAPLLAVEILSPSTQLVDLNWKRAKYEQAGVASYWVVDPVALTLTAWELRDGGYVQVAFVEGEESWTATAPYTVTIVPADLLD